MQHGRYLSLPEGSLGSRHGFANTADGFPKEGGSRDCFILPAQSGLQPETPPDHVPRKTAACVCQHRKGTGFGSHPGS